ncbi:MAG: hypothetical protein IJR90_02720, partial [Clostridia bacterium]|nr:hypothetical protein [Clostridia bacterium]
KPAKVTIRLPRLRDGKDEDALVGLNGVMYRIKRGVDVTVPAGVKEILDNADAEAEEGELYASSKRERI